MNKSALRRAAVLAALTISAAAALAQSWPSKPVSLVVPWPAGGPTDYVARQIQADTQRALGQPVVIENIGGVGGALGVQKVLSSTGGHTMLLGSPELMIPPLTIASVKYQSTDLRTVAELVKAPLVLIARKDLPANNLNELLALAAQRRGNPLTIANTGSGSMFHLVAAKFAQATDMEALHVPYRGYSPALADLMGGQVDMMFTVFAGPMPAMIADGKLKAIGIAASKPIAKYPHIATLTTHPKLADFQFDSWAGIQMPRTTPDAVAERVRKAVYEAMGNPQIRQALEDAGNTIVAPMSLPELEQFYQGEIAHYNAIAKAINLQPQ